MYRRFDFEGDVHTVLDCVPLVVRRKLDLAGLKISLAGWQTLPRADRLALCHLPVETEDDIEVYREVLSSFAARAHVELTPLVEAPILRTSWAPAGVGARLRTRLPPESTPDEATIGRLTEEERYALFKLADPKRDPAKLRALLRELGLGGAEGGVGGEADERVA